MRPANQASTIILQPLSLQLIPREYLFHFRPEPGGVFELLTTVIIIRYL